MSQSHRASAIGAITECGLMLPLIARVLAAGLSRATRGLLSLPSSPSAKP
jgi:hypothetical protein